MTEEWRCDRVRPELAAYAAGELAVAESAAVEAHLDGCADCRRERGFLAATEAGFRSLLSGAAVVLPAASIARLHAAVHAAPEPSLRSRLREWAAAAWNWAAITTPSS